MKKGFAPIVIISAAALLISASLVFAFLQKNQTPEKTTPSPSPVPQYQTDETVYTEESPSVSTEDSRSANWKTYTNKKFGFEFKYPDDYELVEDITYPKGPSEVFSVGIGPNWAEFCCDPWLTITKEGISQAIEKEKTLEEDAFTTKEEKISVANLPATKIVTFNKGLNKDSFINVLLANNGYVFNFATNYVPDGADLFYSFISTFRFD